MTHELMPAIQLLEKELEEAERSANNLLDTINSLRKRAGLAPRARGAAGGVADGALTEIKSDTFYGKKLQTVIREYLGMRRAQNAGPAKPKEIYEALVQGGFQFDSSSDEVAMIGLRAVLRKRTEVFHKLPNGTYGLMEWYPNAKATKPSPASSDDEDDE